MKKTAILVFSLLFFIVSLSAQTPVPAGGGAGSAQPPASSGSDASLSKTVPESQTRAMLAMAEPSYPVTVGDVYALSFLRSYQQETITLMVEGDGSINAGFLGRIQARDLTFVALKALLEKKVTASYPGSSPSVTIVSTGVFQVQVRGEVTQSATVTAWGLTRLSELLSGLQTPFSSKRDIVVTSASGKSSVYDLFKAERFGDLGQNPLIRPGDMVELKRAERIVQVSGQVKRPGSYQLLAGEGVSELVNYYGDGLLVSAKPDTVVLTRKASAEKPESESVVFDLASPAGSLPMLFDGDSVRVASREEYLPIVYVEGAVAGAELGVKQEAGAGNAEALVSEQYRMIRVPVRQGELISQIVRNVSGRLDSRADLKRAFLIREGETAPILIDLEKLLYRYEQRDDVVVKAGDRIVIPYGGNYVFVTGEVKKSSWVGVTALTRLSDTLKDLLTAFSDTRSIRVISESGSESVYDLFKAERFGKLEEDPYVRPGDRIEIRKAERIVQVSGQVKRPGSYQLLAGEGVSELVNYYGDGLLVSAKPDMVVLTRKASAEKPESESVVFDLASPAVSLPMLFDGDSVRVASREEYLPIVYVEGAVAGAEVGVKSDAGTGNAEALASQGYRIVRLQLRQGELLSQVLQSIEGKLDSRADLKRAFLVREKKADKIPLDLEALLYRFDKSKDMVLAAGDRIVIPYGANYVFVTGEVKKSSWVGVTALTRLSDTLKDLLTAFSDTRSIRVISESGSESVYDLFKAERFGKLEEDPYVRPGDRIEIRKAERIVQVSGQVKRPGSYQLLAGEGVSELVNYYGDGLLVSAKPDMVVLTRKASAEKPESESVVFDLASPAGSLPMLFDGDSVRVASREEYLPIVYVEGAVAGAELGVKQEAGAGNAEALVSEQYRMIRVPVRQGELISQIVRNVSGQLDSRADLKRAFLIREGETAPILIDLEKLLYRYEQRDDVVVKAGDRIVIPYGGNYVFVTGEVKKSSWVGVTALTRLSDTLKDLLTAFSDTRSIRVISESGSESVYDLFKAERFGKLEEDPYVRPGDRIEIRKAERIVQVSGQVKRPGSYQLLAGEGVSELVNYYGDGLLVSAKPDMVVLTRKASAEKPESESVVFDLASPAGSLPVLFDGDSVRVASREEYLPIVYVEGAVQSPAQKEQQKTTPAAGTEPAKDPYGLLRLASRKGQLVSQVVNSIKDNISEKADLQHAYIVRGSEQLAINLEALLYRHELTQDRALEPQDRIVIPYGYASVFVKGEVQKSSVLEVYAGMRLSDALKDNLTGLSSIRNLRITRSDGSTAEYDLFMAERFGDLSQNPQIRPGDTIEVKKAERIVKVEGKVRRPGTYVLLPEDSARTLISYYADGLLDDAQNDRLTLERKATADYPDGEKLVFDISAAQLPELKNGDVLRVPGTDEYLPIVYIEGAVAGDQFALSGKDATVTQTNYSIIRAQFKKGLTAATLLRPLREKILSSADLAQAFIIRKGTDKQTAVNLERLLYANDLHYDFELQPEDRVVIPFGSMYVFVAGEVTKSSWVGITGLTRLRDVVLPLVTRYSSIRDVVVRSVDGFEKTYDLFRADRYGDLSQDPFLRPGEEVRVSRLKNLVTIQGEVRRPGTYQLLPGEGLKELIEVYADGFTEKANSTRISLLHYLSETSPVGEKVQFDYAQNTNIKLNLYDVISVPSMQELLPVIWFEGAVGAGATAGTSPETSERSAYNFYPGETISQAVLASRKLFSAVSDIRNAYVLHADGTRKAIDLAKFLYDYDLSGDFALQSNDIIIVPFRQFFVTVSGAVKSPGRYPYIPDRTWEYYVGLAGGFDTERNAGQQIVVYDAKSNKVASAGRMIQPEDNIEAASNSFTYKFFRFSSILTTVLSVVALVINLLKL